jgi:hypothetical protein
MVNVDKGYILVLGDDTTGESIVYSETEKNIAERAFDNFSKTRTRVRLYATEELMSFEHIPTGGSVTTTYTTPYTTPKVVIPAVLERVGARENIL